MVDNLSGYLEKEIETLKQTYEGQYQMVNATIVGVEKWICRSHDYSRRNPFWELEMEYGKRTYHFTGTPCVYHNNLQYTGSRLDIELSLETPDASQKTIFVNVYREVMELTKYSRMSPKLVASFEKNIGKRTDVYFTTNGDIWVNIKPLMDLNYGYYY